MLAPEQILHAVIILSTESEGGLDEALVEQAQEALGCVDEDCQAALDHVNEHRDGGQWGGRSDAVLNRSRERVREAMEDERLPSEGQLGDALNAMVGDDDGEIDPFAELGVQAGAPRAQQAGDDLLAAFMDGDDEEEEEIVDSDGFFSSGDPLEQSIDEEGETSDSSEPETAEETEPEPAEETEPEPEDNPIHAYEMLLSTCWIDGILDPAEAKLLSRKRSELGIDFETHLELLRAMLERSS
tara:strand:+ start:39 stop:764 length:726 start_codon:yes stop_codon:yes gene_type:complete